VDLNFYQYKVYALPGFIIFLYTPFAMTKKRSCFKTAYFDLEMLSKGFNLGYYYKEVKK